MMDDGFEATFVVSVPVERAWSALIETRRDDGTWWLPGWVATIEVTHVDEGKRVEGRKVDEPCANTEIVVALEASDSGTKVTIVQSGFGPDLTRIMGAGLAVGWSHIAADVALFFERGVHGGRHALPWSALGAALMPTAGGLVVTSTWGGLAAAVGMQTGDVLLTVAGAPIVTRPELETLMRTYGTGDQIEVTWVHGTDVRRATAPL
jgi:hypothetical protein